MERQEGYYWVKYDGEYLIAYCRRCGMGYNVWDLPNEDHNLILRDTDLDHINEIRIKHPGELPN